ncbi:MAG TPA: hypothetical protein DCQ93_07935 [Bacteroidetes bacterium]|nr:hypothetical protein [Bacteroidota bacterium]
MKKLLLIATGVILSLGSNAQSVVSSNRGKLTHFSQPSTKIVGDENSSGGLLLTTHNGDNLPSGSNSRSGLSKIKFASSWNLFSVLVSEQQALSGDYDLDLISFAHRQCWSYQTGNSGYIQSSYSTDGGSTWDTSLIIMSDDVNLCRYPSGGIYNPPGNTDKNNAFAVVAGPITDGGSTGGGVGWVGNYFGSSQLNGTNNDQQIELNANSGVFYQMMARLSFTVTSQAKAYVLGSDRDYNSTASIIPLNGLVVNTGSFNSTNNNFDWNRQKLVPAFYHDPSDGSQLFSSTGNMAFSADGMTGYIVVFGVDSLNPHPIQPLIYKTTDAGANWVYQPVFDFSTVSNITSHLVPTSGGGPTLPYFTPNCGVDLVVDYQDHLHIITDIKSAASANPDSAGWFFNDTTQNLLFDVYETSTGWDAWNIDTVHTSSVPASYSPWSYQGGIGYDSRLQASMSEDRTKIFYVWIDTDPSIDLNNLYPNIFVKGWDMAANQTTYTWNATLGTPYANDNYWIFVGDKTFQNGNFFNIPVTTTASQTAGDPGDGPVNHFFVQGIGFSTDQFYPFAVPEINKGENFAVSQNIPNPADNTTSFTINLSKPSSVKVEVTNILGEVVSTLPGTNYKSGMSNINLNVSSLSSGIYFYTVTVGNESVTKKMIVD